VRYLPTKESLYSYRKVCKNWKLTVDNILVSYYTRSPPDTPPQMAESDGYTTRVRKPVLNRFLRRFRHPFFLTNELEILLGERRVNFPKLQMAFSNLGHCITSLTCKISDDIGNPTVTFTNLVELLTHTPNLESLSLAAETGFGPLDIENLERMLPELKNLTSISFWFHDHAIPMAFVQKYGKQIEAFYMGEGIPLPFDRDLGGPFFKRHLPNVKSTSIMNPDSTYLKMLSEIGWPLERLRVDGFLTGDVNEFFEAFGNFSKTLEDLDLDTYTNWNYSTVEDEYEEVVVGEVENHDVPENLGEAFAIYSVPGKLQVLQNLRSLSVQWDSLRQNWFWVFIGVMCKSLKELNFYLENRQVINEAFHEECKDAWDDVVGFESMRKLEKMVFWKNGEVLKTINRDEIVESIDE